MHSADDIALFGFATAVMPGFAARVSQTATHAGCPHDRTMLERAFAITMALLSCPWPLMVPLTIFIAFEIMGFGQSIFIL